MRVLPPLCNSVLINPHDPMSWLALATLAEIKDRFNGRRCFQDHSRCRHARQRDVKMKILSLIKFSKKLATSQKA